MHLSTPRLLVSRQMDPAKAKKSPVAEHVREPQLEEEDLALQAGPATPLGAAHAATGAYKHSLDVVSK